MSKPSAPAVAALLLVGCGKMGSALLSGWLERGLARHYLVVEPAPARPDLLRHREVERVAAPAAIPADFMTGVIVLAVKPQVMAEVLPAYRRFAAQGALFLSIAAG